jgi:hypothetical protein
MREGCPVRKLRPLHDGLCKHCGAKVKWGQTARFKFVPLDPALSVLGKYDYDSRTNELIEVVRDRGSEDLLLWRSHHMTCPNSPYRASRRAR